jgi:hypothetical protein
MTSKRLKSVLNLKISEEKLNIMKADARFYSVLVDGSLKKNFMFHHKRLTKILFAEYFL